MVHKVVLALFLLFTVSTNLTAQEICDNGLDDDGDGLIDLNDSVDCYCSSLSEYLVNGDLESTSCCPGGFSHSTYDNLACLNAWGQCNEASTDYKSLGCYEGTLYHQRNFLYSDVSPVPSGTGVLFFYNNPQNAMGVVNYKEYFGQCLPTPLTAGQTYEFKFTFLQEVSSNPLTLTIFGTGNCGNLPYSGYECPTSKPGWVELASVANVTTAGSWVTYSVMFTPTLNINAVAIGPDCANATQNSHAFSSYSNAYFIDDLSIIGPPEPGTLRSYGTYCANDKILEALMPVLGSFQWYLNGVALVGEIGSQVDISANGYGPGLYSMFFKGVDGSCQVLDTLLTDTDKPIPDFVFNNACEGDTVFFSDQSTDPAGGVINWQWDFGNGNSSLSQNPYERYAGSGNFPVKLVVESSTGCSDSITQTVSIYNNPDAEFDYSGICVDDLISFSDNSLNGDGNLIDWLWDFGSGNGASGQNTGYSYTESGTYAVQLIVTDDNGCVDTIIKNVSISGLPISDFDILNDNLISSTGPFVIQFDNYSTDANNWLWGFGDGNLDSINIDTENAYLNGGNYTVTLIVWNIDNCYDTLSRQITIEQSELPIYTPNTFTPNEDGKNDFFQPLTQEGRIDDYEMLIYNRWGQIVFESNDIIAGWDGFYNGEMCQEGIYTWSIKYNFLTNNRTEILRGHITLMR